MKENIETKDVQRTEYLDKNGLDMLWAKVKENTHNQVEVERKRATQVEGTITLHINREIDRAKTVLAALEARIAALEAKHTETA